MRSAENIAYVLFEKGFSFEDIGDICRCNSADVLQIVNNKIDKSNTNLYKRFQTARNEELLKLFQELKSIRRVAIRCGYSQKSLKEFFGIEDVSDNGMLRYHLKDIEADFKGGMSVRRVAFKYDIDEKVVLEHIKDAVDRVIRLRGGNIYCFFAVGKVLKFIDKGVKMESTIANRTHIPIEDVKKIIVGLNFCNTDELNSIRNYMASMTWNGNLKGTGLPPEKAWSCLELKQQGLKNEAIAFQLHIPTEKVSKCIGHFRKYGLLN